MPRSGSQPSSEDPLLTRLAGGDRRSIGAASAVVDLALADPSRIPVLIEGLTASDPLIRMRCADVLEKVTALRPDLLQPYRRKLIQLANRTQQQEVRWHLAQLIPRLPLSPPERRRVLAILAEYLKDKSSIVRTFSMQAMADIAVQDSRFRPPVLKRLAQLTKTGTPAMRIRGRKLLRNLRATAGPPPPR